MTQVPPSPIIAIDDEKISNPHEAETGGPAMSIIEKDDTSMDGDDALKLAGTHAHHFDEKYYVQLRRKIVSHLKPTRQSRQ